jgi:hypothetical protein
MSRGLGVHVMISSRVVIYLPKRPACPHAFPPAHPHETHRLCVFFSVIFILVLFYFILFHLLIYLLLLFLVLVFFCFFSVLFLLIEYCKGGVPIRQFKHVSGLLTSIY